MSPALPGDEELLQTNDMQIHKLRPKIVDPLTVSGRGRDVSDSVACSSMRCVGSRAPPSSLFSGCELAVLRKFVVDQFYEHVFGRTA